MAKATRTNNTVEINPTQNMIWNIASFSIAKSGDVDGWLGCYWRNLFPTMCNPCGIHFASVARLRVHCRFQFGIDIVGLFDTIICANLNGPLLGSLSISSNDARFSELSDISFSNSIRTYAARAAFGDCIGCECFVLKRLRVKKTPVPPSIKPRNKPASIPPAAALNCAMRM